MPIRQMSKEQILRANKMLDDGVSKSRVAAEMGVTRVTLRKILKEYSERGDEAIDETSKRYPTRAKIEYQASKVGKGIGREIKERKSIWDMVLYGCAG